jgi:hypothetical protein
VARWLDNARSTLQYSRAGRCNVWDEIRVPVAFLVAPLGAPLVVGLPVLPVLFVNPQAFVFVVAMTMSASYAITLLFGLPLFLILRKLRWTSFWIAPVAGCIVPFIAIVIVLASPTLFRQPPPPASMVMLIALCGATVGTILWLIARPDRNLAPSSTSTRSN